MAKPIKILFGTILVLIYTLLFAEGFIRIFSPEKIMPRYVTGTSYGIRGNIPNSNYWHTTPDTQVFMHINSKGIRANREYNYQKKKGTCRIVLLGDSFFMGYEVSLEDSFAYQLEKRLNMLGYPCEVINLAVSGFGTAEMLIKLQKVGLKYHPDIVIFQWHESDVDENTRSNLFGIDESGKLVRKNKTFLPGIRIRDYLMQYSIYRWLIENSQLYSAVREKLATKIKQFITSRDSIIPAKQEVQDKTDAQINNPLDNLMYKQELSGKLMLEAKKTAESAGSKFMVVEVPVKWKHVKMHSSLGELPDDVVKQLEVVSPMTSFKKEINQGKLVYYENGAGHWNELGNDIITKLVLTDILQNGWLNKFHNKSTQK